MTMSRSTVARTRRWISGLSGIKKEFFEFGVHTLIVLIMWAVWHVALRLNEPELIGFTILGVELNYDQSTLFSAILIDLLVLTCVGIKRDTFFTLALVIGFTVILYSLLVQPFPGMVIQYYDGSPLLVPPWSHVAVGFFLAAFLFGLGLVLRFLLIFAWAGIRAMLAKMGLNIHINVKK
jgi:hypothetical protein